MKSTPMNDADAKTKKLLCTNWVSLGNSVDGNGIQTLYLLILWLSNAKVA